MPVETTATNIIGFTIALLTILSQIELWQRKEYRLDRLRSYLADREWQNLPWPFLIISVALFLISSASQFFNLPAGETAARLTLVSVIAYHGIRIWKRGVFRPKPTAKAILIALITLTAAGLVLASVPHPAVFPAQLWISVIFILPFIIAFAVLLANLASSFQKRKTVSRARNKINRCKKLVTVGITGSYGKTSVKHFMDQILTRSGVPHAVSSAHRNDLLPVARDIIENLKPEHKVYVAEMGAYRKGEIAAMTALVNPEVAIVTAVRNQHLALFGSVENLAEAKWELVNALPPRGTAILNADDPVVRKRGQREDKTVLWYSIKEKKDFWAENTTFAADHINATIWIKSKSKPVKIPLIGEGALSNALAAAAAAHTLRISAQDIFRALEKLSPVERTMQCLAGLSGATVIDDSYSANEDGVIKAIEHLYLFKERQKIIILTPLIELGSRASEAHKNIGKHLAKSGAKTYVAGTNYRKDIQEGYDSQKGVSLQFISNPGDLLCSVKYLLNEDTVILLEGRIPDIVRQSLINNKN